MVEKPSHATNMLVKLENLDHLLTLAGEVIIASSNLGLASKNLHALYESKELLNSETIEAVNDIAVTTADISSNLHHLVQVIRTVDLKDLGFRARRLVRDIARRTGKRVIFNVEGEETSVDKTIIEKLYDPISHQLRNAIDHGIEDSLTRSRLGKPEEGRITMRINNTENETFIEIEDDGAGVDMQALRNKGIATGKIKENDPFTEDDALDLMCSAGISTAKKVSEVSGRGVGMDVVRDSINVLGGSMSFKTEKGKGTTFTFCVPLISAVNIVDTLVVRSGKYRFAFPISSVVTTMSIPLKEINTTLGKGEMVKYLNHLLPLHDLNKVLGGEPAEYKGEMASVLVVEHKGANIALRISEFYSPQKLVIIPFNGSLSVEGLSGTTILGGRQLGFIVDVSSLTNLASGRKMAHQYKAETEYKQTKERELLPIGGGEVKPKEQELAVATQDGTEGEQEETRAAMEEFIVEIEKLLPDLNEALFALESSLGDTGQINSAFRLFHTIKGNFIMIGLTKGGETVHSVESVLDRARSRKLKVNPEVMDILMDGASYIEEVLRLSKSGEWQDKANIEILEKSAKLLPERRTEQRVSMDVASEEIKLSHEAYYRINIYRKRKTPLYRCYIEFDSRKQPPFLIACLMYKRACEFGDVLGTVPSLVDVENGFIEGKFKLLIASDIDADVLEKKLVSLFTQHYGAKMVKFGSFE